MKQLMRRDFLKGMAATTGVAVAAGITGELSEAQPASCPPNTNPQLCVVLHGTIALVQIASSSSFVALAPDLGAEHKYLLMTGNVSPSHLPTPVDLNGGYSLRVAQPAGMYQLDPANLIVKIANVGKPDLSNLKNTKFQFELPYPNRIYSVRRYTAPVLTPPAPSTASCYSSIQIFVYDMAGSTRNIFPFLDWPPGNPNCFNVLHIFAEPDGHTPPHPQSAFNSYTKIFPNFPHKIGSAAADFCIPPEPNAPPGLGLYGGDLLSLEELNNVKCIGPAWPCGAAAPMKSSNAPSTVSATSHHVGNCTSLYATVTGM